MDAGESGIQDQPDSHEAWSQKNKVGASELDDIMMFLTSQILLF